MSVANTSFNLRLDKKLKEQSFAVIERYGLTPTQAIKLFLKQVADRKILPLSFNYQADEPNEETQQAMLMADKGLNDCYEVNSAEELTKVMEKIYNE
ncbi:MAG: type II toxin-antitoxin system RelB/DinJ family antitoxin [Neisseriaceae bacterium]|nr:type II toxin-antitoxin system RelB/DinJ family antitoxin [Neisseriaceae bacterium]